MSSTNHTSHYNLPQFVSTDKPAWLTDVNGAMSAIDTGIYNAKTTADTAVTDAGNADTKADNAQTTANTALTTASTAQTTADGNTTKIGDLSNLQTSAKTNLVSAVNEVKSDGTTATSQIASLQNSLSYIESQIQKFNLTDFRTLTVTRSNTNITVGGSLQSATNSDGSIGKIYGYLEMVNGSSSTQNNVTFTTSDTGFRPESAITINGVITGLYKQTSTNLYNSGGSLTINTNGTVTFTLNFAGSSYRQIGLVPCLLFMVDFGDEPIEPSA